MTDDVGAAPYRCAPAAQARGDDPVATAPPAPRWFLIEQPGPWGRNALRESLLDSGVAGALAQRAAVAGVRIVLIRRPGRSAPAPRRWGYADTHLGREGLWWGTYDDDADLLGVPLDGSEGTLSTAPALLVCAHGRHDPCCAMRGRPVAAALAQAYPDATWECSHVGGDRFAANLVVLPHGLYYGHMTPELALTAVKAYGEGRVLASALRGRASLSPAVQAAQHHARIAIRDGVLGREVLQPDAQGSGSRADEDGLAALWPVAVEHLDETTSRVVLAHDGSLLHVTVRCERAPAEVLTCGAPEASAARRWRLTDLAVETGV
ncbi:MAG: sucrase ferredoxin [Actinomycetota bacterium]|nr:sucrase ferredoxin [Actinomycetota bacterium]